MDVRVRDGQIQPLLYRISAVGLAELLRNRPEGVGAPDNVAAMDALDEWPTDDRGRLLCWSEADRDAVAAALAAIECDHLVVLEDQPDPELLAALQGTCSSRSEALAALSAGTAPVPTLQQISARLDALQGAVVARGVIAEADIAAAAEALKPAPIGDLKPAITK